MSGMKIEDAEKWLKGINHPFFIVGYKSDGYKGIPATYTGSTALARNEIELLGIIEDFMAYKIFDMSPTSFDLNKYINKVADDKKKTTEDRERELLKKLKAKYEK